MMTNNNTELRRLVEEACDREGQKYSLPFARNVKLGILKLFDQGLIEYNAETGMLSLKEDPHKNA